MKVPDARVGAPGPRRRPARAAGRRRASSGPVGGRPGCGVRPPRGSGAPGSLGGGPPAEGLAPGGHRLGARRGRRTRGSV